MKVTKIALRDLSAEQKAVPGQFILEIYPEPEAEKGEGSIYDTGMLGWSEKSLGSVSFGENLPGCQKTYSLTDFNPPLLAFQIRNYSHPATQQRINASTNINATTREHLDAEMKEQLALKRELNAPTVESAVMTKLLATLVGSKAITPEFANETLTRELEIGKTAAQGLLQRGTEYLASQQRQH